MNNKEERTLEPVAAEKYTDPKAAVAQLENLYGRAVEFLAVAFSDCLNGDQPSGRIRAFYPEVRITTTSYAQIDSRLAFGQVCHRRNNHADEAKDHCGPVGCCIALEYCRIEAFCAWG